MERMKLIFKHYYFLIKISPYLIVETLHKWYKFWKKKGEDYFSEILILKSKYRLQPHLHLHFLIVLLICPWNVPFHQEFSKSYLKTQKLKLVRYDYRRSIVFVNTAFEWKFQEIWFRQIAFIFDDVFSHQICRLFAKYCYICVRADGSVWIFYKHLYILLFIF